MKADLAGAFAHPDAAPSRALPVTLRRALAPLLLTLVLGPAPVATAHAQGEPGDPRTLTVEELERYIAEQKAALDRVRENRDITSREAREVRAALAEKEVARLEREAEIERLCRERDALDPGSYERCVGQSGD